MYLRLPFYTFPYWGTYMKKSSRDTYIHKNWKKDFFRTFPFMVFISFFLFSARYTVKPMWYMMPTSDACRCNVNRHEAFDACRCHLIWDLRCCKFHKTKKDTYSPIALNGRILNNLLSRKLDLKPSIKMLQSPLWYM